MRLVIAEKPSAGKIFAAVLGAKTKNKGYLEGNGWLVSWCYGHLTGLADCGTYDPAFTKWRKEDLPIVPEPFRFTVKQDTNEQYERLCELMNRSDVEEIVNACDAGREGERIFRTVYDLCNCKKPVSRLWISSMEDNAVREGFNHLESGAGYENLYRAALCRAEADWLVGINATRFFTLLYRNKLNVGRVMSNAGPACPERSGDCGLCTGAVLYSSDRLWLSGCNKPSDGSGYGGQPRLCLP